MREATRARPAAKTRVQTAQRAVVTVLKADISGSTLLGERLDPEELRRVLGSYFAALAREVHRHGGIVDKYIGDAVVAIFGVPDARDDDAARAVVAAVAMQEAIERENLELQTRYGVRLACRIGIATGSVVGGAIAEDVQATYTVVGEPVGLVEALESASPLGSVLVSPATRRAASATIRFAPVERVRPKGATKTIAAHRVLGLRQAARTRVDVTRAGTTSASLQVTGERPDVLAEERKVVTVLFADISSSEPLGATLDPGKLRVVLGAYFGVLARAIQRYGGTVDKYIGDAVMAVFGAPVSHEDDGVRAIHAALAIQRSAESLNATLEKTYGVKIAIRIGINTGEVVAGLLPGEVLAYTVTGDAVNTAQRIESAAPAHGVLISESTLALVRSAFFFEPLAPIALKGKAEPVRVFRVLGPERRASPRGGPKIVGRDAELAQLFTRYRDALAVRGQVVHVHGEAGVGKTRLVAEFLSGLPKGTTRLRVRANSYEQSTPYALVAEVLRRTLEISATDDEQTARNAIAVSADLASVGEAGATLLLEVLGYEVRSPLDPAGKRRLIVTMFREGLRQRSQREPVVILIEDLHWRDASSGDVLRETVPTISSLRCLFVSTSREPTDIAWPAEMIGLEALSGAAAAELIDRLATTTIDEATRSMILERTGGNPFFIEEVVRSMRPGRELTVPATVQDLLEARLDGLEASPRRVAQGASVIGRTFWTRVLARVTPEEDLDPALATLERERFVSRVLLAEPTYSFAHALVQEVAYRTQLIAHRRKAHVVVGDAYSDMFGERIEEFIDTLAFHYRRGDDDPKARTWLMRAGRRAQRLYANAEALDYFNACVERSADDDTSRADALEAIGDVQRVVGKYEDALVSYAQAGEARADLDVVERARLRRKTAIVHQLRGDMTTALAMFEDALTRLPADASSERSHAELNIAEVRWRQGHYDAAIKILQAAIADAERGRDNDARAEALKQLGTVHSHRGDLEQALAYFDQSLAAYGALGDVLGEANVHNNVGLANRRRSRHAEAAAAYRRALAIRERIGDQLGRVHSHNNLGQIEYLRGDLATAEADFAAGLEIARSLGYTMGVGATGLGLGATKVARGDTAAGVVELRAAVDVLEKGGSLANLVDGLRDLSLGYLAAGSRQALTVAERAVEVARGLGLPESQGIALQVLGMARAAAGDVTGAAVALEASRAELERVSDRQELARTLAALGRVYARLPESDVRRADSEALIGQARAIFTELGAALDLRRLGAA